MDVRRLRAATAAGAVAVALVLAGCGGSSGTPEPSPTPSVPLPTKAEDVSTVKKATITAADLGKPWVQPKKVNSVKEGKNSKGGICPNGPTLGDTYDSRAVSSVALTKGTESGATIASFGVRALGPGDQSAYTAALLEAIDGCRQWKAVEGNYVVMRKVTAPDIPGADETVAYVQRIYADKAHKQLQYVRHEILVSTGRVISGLELAFITSKKDPNGDDFTPAAQLIEKQVAKTKATFGESLDAT